MIKQELRDTEATYHERSLSTATQTPELEEAPLIDGSPYRTVRILMPPSKETPTRTLKTVVLDFTGRTTPKAYRLQEDGKQYECDTWQRLDGEIDFYEDMLAEAKANGRNPALTLTSSHHACG